MRGPGAPTSMLFRLIVPATSIFIITILSLIAVVFSDGRSPVAQFLNEHGDRLLIWELIAVLILSFLAMAFDRWKTLRDAARTSETQLHLQQGESASTSATK